MRRKSWKIPLLVGTITAIWAGFTSCQSYTHIKKLNSGTGVGNPMAEGTAKILSAVCGLIHQCESQVSVVDCEQGVLRTGGIHSQLGLPSGSYNSYSGIVDAEIAGLIQADPTATQRCSLSITGLACQDPRVQGAYDPNATNPFAGVAGLIPTDPNSSCATVFKPEVKAFPTAEGFGQASKGGRGGRIVRVTNLQDSGAGSLREALTASGPRIVIFDVSGTILLQSDVVIAGEQGSYLTVAGQTSPGGVQTRGPYSIRVSDGAHDVVLRHLRLRPGGPSAARGDWSWPNQGAGILVSSAISAPTYNVIVDHCSVEWTNSFNGAFGNTRDIGFQWNIFANSIIDSGTDFISYWAGFVLGETTSDQLTLTFHHNLIANSVNTPFVGYSRTADIRNNVFYNWQGNNAAKWGRFVTNSSAFGNMINNHFIEGPSSGWPYFWVANGGSTRIDGTVADRGGTKIYTEGNWGRFCPSGCADDWDNGFYLLDYHEAGITQGGQPPASAAQFRSSIAFPVPPVGTHPTSALQNIVLTAVGADKPSRDSADASVISDVLNKTGQVPSTAGPWPNLTGGSSPTDSDGDGIPDAWETAHGLDPGNSGDGSQTAPNGYTHVENYLNELAGDPSP